MARYAETLKNRVVAKLLPPESASVSAIAKEVGVTVQTLERWRDEAQSRPSRGRTWTAGARLEAVITAAALDEAGKSVVWCREHGADHSDHAAHLVRRTALAEGIAAMGAKPVLHGDNGSTLKATTVQAMLNWLGVKPSYSRPRVSDDNAYAESLFRTAKYRPEFPTKGFADLDKARTWANGFVRWYNFDHRHSGIRYVSPAQRHAGDDHEILAARHALLYLQARELNPARWSGNTRNWTPVGAITLNPERDTIVKTHLASNNIQPLAA